MIYILGNILSGVLFKKAKHSISKILYIIEDLKDFNLADSLSAYKNKQKYMKNV